MLFGASVVFADGGLITAEANFSVTAPPVCVPTGKVDLTFADIDNQTTETVFYAFSPKIVNISNCPFGSFVKVSGAPNMVALDGSNVLSSVGDSVEGLIGLDLHASASPSGGSSSSL